MKKLVSVFALATAMMAGQALAQDLNGPGASATGTPAAAGGPAAAAAVGTDGQALRVVSSNGIDIGTAISTTTGPNGTFITIRPAFSFMTGIDNFQIAAAQATNADGQIKLAMTDTALRAQVASAQTSGGTPTVR